jgi:hypothetical protein
LLKVKRLGKPGQVQQSLAMKHQPSTIKIFTAGQHDMLAHDIAVQCVANLVPELPTYAAAMGVAELCGYVRVRALPGVRAAASRISSEQRMPPEYTERLIASALDRVVHRVVDELHAPPIIAMPTAHVRQRAA